MNKVLSSNDRMSFYFQMIICSIVPWNKSDASVP